MDNNQLTKSQEYYIKNREKILLANKTWHQNNKERVKERKRRAYQNGYRPYRIRQREKVLLAYGGKCQRCDIKDFRVLDLDHVNGGGGLHRKVASTDQIYRSVIEENFPPTYRVLCRNCNWIVWLENKKPRITI